VFILCRTPEFTLVFRTSIEYQQFLIAKFVAEHYGSIVWPDLLTGTIPFYGSDRVGS
jgi:hypothetical protein